uniref:Uncharacterized protein n=1 Tax=Panagrolaimus sp. PS1159 TaxID=55785 RepID=A0AC35EVG5_9BILA
MFIVPFIVNNLAPHNNAIEWRNVFLVNAVVLIMSNLIFVLMCSAHPAYWTTDEFSRNASRAGVVCPSSPKLQQKNHNSDPVSFIEP